MESTARRSRSHPSAIVRKISGLSSYLVDEPKSSNGDHDRRQVLRRVSRAFSRAVEVGETMADEFGGLIDFAGTMGPTEGKEKRSTAKTEGAGMEKGREGGKMPQVSEKEEISEERKEDEGVAVRPAMKEHLEGAEDEERKMKTGMDTVGKKTLEQPSKKKIGEIGRREQDRTISAEETEAAARRLSPQKVIFRDKLAYLVGVFNVVLTAWWIGAHPSKYYYLWTLKAVTLFPLRWLSYRKRGWHYLMFEYCYVANCIGMYYCFFAPSSAVLYKVTFSMGAGPLMWSILAMRNSLVFHDIDKTTTLMMHASPALVSWTLRWYPPPEAMADPAFQVASWRDLLFWPVLIYLFWVVSYYILNFIILRDIIEGQGMATMFTIMVPRHNPEKVKRSALARTIVKAPDRLQPIVYLCVHAVAATASFLPTLVFFRSFWVHTAAVVFCLSLAAWNGGNYYFEVFAAKYMQRVYASLGLEEVQRGTYKEKGA